MHKIIAIGFLVIAALLPVTGALAFDDTASTGASPFNGLYAGLHLGYVGAAKSEELAAWGNNWTYNALGMAAGAEFSGSASGGLFGAQVGVNFVQDAGLLIGGELSVSWMNTQFPTTDDAELYGTSCNCSFEGAEFQSQVDALGSAELKLGYANQQFMFYGSVGLALAAISWTDSMWGDSYIGDWDLTVSDPDLLAGWTLGVGGAVMVAPDVSVSLSYNYYDFGTADIASEGTLVAGIDSTPEYVDGGYAKSVALTSQSIKLGINLHY